MKKILLASSALVLVTGHAFAQDGDITLGGDGYMGAVYGDDLFQTTANDPDADFEDRDTTSYAFVYDLDFDITASGETDGGLAFGANMDIDEMDTSQGIFGYDSEIFISGGFGRLAMGDTDGGAEAIIGDLAGVGLTGLGDFNENLFLLAANPAPDGPLALYQYDAGPLALALGLNDDEGYSVGAGYDTEVFSVGLAYESIQEGSTFEFFDSDFIGDDGFQVQADNDVDHIIAAASTTFSNVTLKGTYGYLEANDFDVDQYGVSAESTFDLVSVAAYFRRVEFGNDGTTFQDLDGDDEDEGEDVNGNFYGVGAEYDLGGGASLVGGLAYIDIDDREDTAVIDFGLAFSF